MRPSSAPIAATAREGRRPAIRFVSAFGPSGYAMAAIAHLRGLVNAGFSVEWRVVADGWGPSRASLVSPAREPAFAAGDAALSDLGALVDATSLPLDCDTVVAFTVPELWPAIFTPGCRAIGCTVWETDRLPPHWRPLLALADRVVVPCAQNRDVVATALPPGRIAVVPHVRRHAWNAFAPAELAALRRELALDGVDTVFYSIGAWHPRKDMGTMLRAFMCAFSAADSVALVVKTDPLGFAVAPEYRREPAEGLARALIDSIAAELDHAPPRVVVLPYEMSGRAIDALHLIGDAYLSTAHGEGFALGAFDAATFGRPVLMTGWGGHRDYLGDDAAWPGALPWRFASVPVFPPEAPSYWRSQHWADVDVEGAAAALRAFVGDPVPHREAAAGIAERIATAFGEPVITPRFVDALGLA